jgi:hypothetical protein
MTTKGDHRGRTFSTDSSPTACRQRDGRRTGPMRTPPQMPAQGEDPEVEQGHREIIPKV